MTAHTKPLLDRWRAIEAGEAAEQRGKRASLLALLDRLPRSPHLDEETARQGVSFCRRVVLLASQITAAGCTVRAVVSQIAALGDPVSGRTIQRWAAAAERLGILRREVRAARLGRRAWNEWTVDVAAVRRLITAEMGDTPRHTPTHPDTRGDTVSPLVSPPLHTYSYDSSPPPPVESAARGLALSAAPASQGEGVFDLRQESNTAGQASSGTQTSAPGLVDSPHQSEWSTLEREVRACGVIAAAKAMGAARSRGVSPREIRDLVVWWQRDQSRWDSPAGVLYARIMAAIPGDDPGIGWPPPSRAWEFRRRGLTAGQASGGTPGSAHCFSAAREQEQRAEAAADRQRLAALEARHGAELDRIEREEPERFTALCRQAGVEGKIWARAVTARRGSLLAFFQNHAGPNR